MTTPESNTELLARVAIEARTRAVGWLTVIAAFIGVYLIGTALIAVGRSAASTVVGALGLLIGVTALVALLAAFVPLARAGWNYHQAKAQVVSEVTP
ncbi:Uncharacterised protein [Mycobacteroides abscessus subsp. abscessus]|uniref:hypothetical protein n=1 Tax=Mycobacteroides abscessus TaxID=36809 RepID=UPI00092C3AD3|nr:hypothetical protein [Mycobacteroides abscessus]SIC64197.1 Uncharacterised protein [Mycobacteroides abscessus subsp. abscessus]SIG65185.1 Uncharacterised protein [Mycobacteroides abscessus subsp. abscessus]